MKNYVCMAAALLFSLTTLAQMKQAPAESSLQWHTNLQEANQLSQASKKPIFAFFTGSDWCGWCKKLQRDVFAKPEFVTWAKKNVILLELDYPRTKQLPAELVQQNNSLQQALSVSGYPTIWMMFATIDPTNGSINLSTLGSLGYPRDAVPGNEQVKFLDDANKILSLAKK
jgi:thioredoxin-related protein